MDRWPWVGEWRCVGCDSTIETRYKKWPASGPDGENMWELLTNCPICGASAMIQYYEPPVLGFTGFKRRNMQCDPLMHRFTEYDRKYESEKTPFAKRSRRINRERCVDCGEFREALSIWSPWEWLPEMRAETRKESGG